ncbi:MAG TPA: hypothetical protein VK901_08125 [Nitrospiraceae bacterium]|nr:hypothetical protein [Nitrospiraceae bacterium]
MRIPYSRIKTRYKRVRHFLTNDLKLLVIQPSGGNYLAAFMIACACETISWFRYGTNKGDSIFAEKLLSPAWQPVASSLYDAMRNWIAHRYETKTLRIADKRLEIGISWKKKPHLSFSRNRKVVFLNIQTLSEQVFHMLDEYEEELKTNSSLRERFYQSMKGKWQQKPDGGELEAWKTILSSAARTKTIVSTGHP